MGPKILVVVGWLTIVGGMLFSAVHIVMLLAQQAFDRVAGAGMPALGGLLLGSLLVWAGLTAARARSVPPADKDGEAPATPSPTSPTKVLGAFLLLLGLVWAASGLRNTLSDASVSAYAMLSVLPGLGVALVGLILVAAGRPPRRP